jgi:hypothetical protein
VARLRQTLLDTVTPEDLQAIVARLIEAARQGDIAAARLVLAYTVGKPTSAVDPDTLDVQEWQHWQQMPVQPETLQSLQTPLQVPLACVLARTLLPLLQGDLSQTLAQQLQPSAPPSGTTPPLAPAPASPSPDAAPASRSEPRQPAPRPAKKDAASPGSARQEAPRTPSASREPLPPGSDTTAPGANQEELEWLLGIYQSYLDPDRPSPESPPVQAASWPPQPVFPGGASGLDGGP